MTADPKEVGVPVDWIRGSLPAEQYQTARKRLLTILRRRSYVEGEFVLSSGARTTRYVDGKMTTHHPEGAFLSALLFLEALRGDPVRAAGGPVLGSVPLAGAVDCLSYLQGRPMLTFSVRKEAKGHGTEKEIEGGPLEPGMEVALIEDVVTTGSALLWAVEKVTASGCRPVKILALVDREAGAKEKLEQHCPYRPLFLLSELSEIS